MSFNKITKIKKRSTGQVYVPYPQNFQDALDTAQAQAERAEQAAVSAVETVRATQEVVGGYMIPHYDTTVTYESGDLVFYNDFIWRCKNHKNPGAWAESAWVQTSLYQEYMRLRGNEGDYENVTIRLVFPDNAVSLVNQTVNVTYNNTTYSILTNNNGEAEISIPFGMEYVVSVPNITGYTTPASRGRVATMNTRLITMAYLPASTGISVIDKYGILTDIDSWDVADNANAEAILFSNSIATFALKLGEPVSNGQWQAQNVLIPEVSTTTSQATATTIVTGPLDTDRIVSFAKTKAAENPSSWPTAAFYAPAACYCLNRLMVINGITYNGYLPAAGELQVAKDNQSDINAALTKLGVRTYNFASGGWWSSSQCSAVNAWGLRNGSLGNYRKDDSYQVLPFFDF